VNRVFIYEVITSLRWSAKALLRYLCITLYYIWNGSSEVEIKQETSRWQKLHPMHSSCVELILASDRSVIKDMFYLLVYNCRSEKQTTSKIWSSNLKLYLSMHITQLHGISLCMLLLFTEIAFYLAMPDACILN